MKQLFKTIRYSIYAVLAVRIVLAIYWHVKSGIEE